MELQEEPLTRDTVSKMGKGRTAPRAEKVGHNAEAQAEWNAGH